MANSGILKFKDGLIPSVDVLYQRRTYYGLIEGVPNKWINASMIESIKAEAERRLDVKKYHLIVPEETILPARSNEHEPDSKWVKAMLPRIVCMAELSHYKPIRDQEKECSQLGLIWFQEEYAFPIPDDILDQINTLEWGQLSSDEYL